MKFSARLSNNQKGYSLTELIIATALCGFVALAIAKVFDLQLFAVRAISLKTTRISLMTGLRKNIGDIGILKASMNQPGNEVFRACVCGSTAGCASGQSFPFALYEPGDVPPKTSTKYYDLNGLPCLATAPNCLIQVTTTFIAQCLPVLPSAFEVPPPTCTAPAEFVSVFVDIQQNPTFQGTGLAFEEFKTAAYTQVTDLIPPGGCP